MSPLANLHHRLSRLRQRRRLLRWSLALTTLGLAIVWTLIAIFVIDVSFSLSIFQRAALFILGAGALVWAARRFVAPWLGIHETETDIALLVQKQHGIDSDLVAALQFDRASDEFAGSQALKTAVIQRVAEVSQQLDVKRGLDSSPFVRRAGLLLLSVGLVAGIALFFPEYANVFLSRLLFSERHYPTDTKLERVAVNGVAVWQTPADTMHPMDHRSAKGQPLTFVVVCSGELADAGEIECRSLEHQTSRRLELRRLTDDEILASEAIRTFSDDGVPRGFYQAELPHLVEDFEYTLRIGDVWTDPARVNVIDPPVVELEMKVTGPDYARLQQAAVTSPRHVSVLPGSKIELFVRPLNEKVLKSASLRMDDGETSTTYEMTPRGEPGNEWVSPDGTKLSQIERELRFQIQVEDEDGLGLESPIQGLVQIKTDRPPTALASIVHRVVLPTAQPVMEYRVHDDYGLADVELQVQIEPATTNDDASDVAAPTKSVTIEIVNEGLPLPSEKLPLAGKFPFDLKPLQLNKGDRLRLTLVATDYRGQNAGTVGQSESLLLEISDEAGVLAAIAETDEHSEKRLGDVIKQQMGVGGGR